MILDERGEFCDATALNTGAAGSYLLGDVVDGSPKDRVAKGRTHHTRTLPRPHDNV